MSKKKKILLSVISVLLVCSLAAGGIIAARNAGKEEVLVVPVSEMSMNMYYGESMEGQVATNVTQKVTMDKDAIIEQTYVNVGDQVHRGDKLISFDMTLKEMELEIAMLTRQQQEQNLKKAQDRLKSLKNGGPIEEETESTTGPVPGGSSGSVTDEDEADLEEAADPAVYPDDLDTSEEPGSEARTNAAGTESTSIAFGWAGAYTSTRSVIAAAYPSLLSFEAVEPLEEGEGTDGSESQGFVEEELPPEPEEELEPFQDENGNWFYRELLSLEDRHSGTGTREDPYVFLCSSENGQVIVRGSFLNEAAGYDAEGVELLAEGGFWFRLEFHQDDTWSTEDEGESSLTGYYVRNGGLLISPVDPEEEIVYELADAADPGLDLDPEQVVTPEPTPDPDMDGSDDYYDDGYYDDGYYDDDYDDGEEDGGTGLTREEAIKQQEREVREIELQIRASNIRISKLQRELEKKTVVSTVNGVVKSMGDPVTGNYSGDAFMVIESDDGYYVQGSISELMLDTLNVGDILTCMSYESGNYFQAEITEVSEFPGNSNYYYGSGNTNSSYYPFVAKVLEDLELKNGEGVNITLESSQSMDTIDLSEAFVRSENGQYYVYKDENGKLKKQIVEARMSTDGYSIQILSGLSLDDKIAFPYGSSVKEGAPTKEGTLDQIYGY